MVIMETMRMMKTETPGNIIYRDDVAFRFADIGVSFKVFSLTQDKHLEIYKAPMTSNLSGFGLPLHG